MGRALSRTGDLAERIGPIGNLLSNYRPSAGRAAEEDVE
jgi:hypothetical protein